MVVDAIVRALAEAMPERVPAGHHGLLGGAVVFFGTHPKTRRRFVVQSIEGGGWGDPLQRDPRQVCEDVAEALVSATAARKLYGVLLRRNMSLDERATKQLRDRLRSRRVAPAKTSVKTNTRRKPRSKPAPRRLERRRGRR